MAQKYDLDLSTTVERPNIRIDGKNYQMYHPQELDLASQYALQALAEKARAIQGKKDPTRDDLAVLSTVARESLPEIMVNAPKAVLARLSDDQRFQIIDVFNGLTRKKAAKSS